MEGHVCFARMNGRILYPHFGGQILRMRRYLKHHRHHRPLHCPQTPAPTPLWWTVTAPCWGATAPHLPNSIPCVAMTGWRTEICRSWTVHGHVGEVGFHFAKQRATQDGLFLFHFFFLIVPWPHIYPFSSSPPIPPCVSLQHNNFFFLLLLGSQKYYIFSLISLFWKISHSVFYNCRPLHFYLSKCFISSLYKCIITLPVLFL
jgi:hypothetical protein